MDERTENWRWGRPRRASRAERSAKLAAAAQAADALHDIGASRPPAGSFWFSSRLWLILILCLFGSTGASFVFFKFIVPKVPPELVGTWQITAGPQQGWTLEVHRDGAAAAVRYERGQKIVTDYRAKVEGKTMWLTTRDEKSGKEDTSTHTIVELNADELVIRDEDQKTYQMKRIDK
jgi:uncharacterized protein (TIGR03066 family)